MGGTSIARSIVRRLARPYDLNFGMAGGEHFEACHENAEMAGHPPASIRVEPKPDSS
jgi:hypothetical protein